MDKHLIRVCAQELKVAAGSLHVSIAKAAMDTGSKSRPEFDALLDALQKISFVIGALAAEGAVSSEDWEELVTTLSN